MNKCIQFLLVASLLFSNLSLSMNSFNFASVPLIPAPPTNDSKNLKRNKLIENIEFSDVGLPKEKKNRLDIPVPEVSETIRCDQANQYSFPSVLLKDDPYSDLKYRDPQRLAFLKPGSESYADKKIDIDPSSLSWWPALSNFLWDEQYNKIEGQWWGDKNDIRRKFPDRIKVASNNKGKNRYGNVLPYDENFLRVENVGGVGYFNGSFIESNDLLNSPLTFTRFIAGSAPIAEGEYQERTESDVTTTDFWQGVWQQKIPVVVNLTDFDEIVDNYRRHKSEQYWPNLGKKLSFGDIDILNEEEIEIDNFSVKALLLTKANQSRLVYLIHYRNWPDSFDTDDSPIKKDLIKIVDTMERSVNQAKITENLDGPVFVHCSAGIRRTGAFITVALAKAYAEATGKMPLLPTIIGDMQKMRFGLVGSVSFCFLIRDVLLDYFKKISEVAEKKKINE